MVTTKNGRKVDPLVLLRECTIAKKKVHWCDDHVEIDGDSLHRSTKCGFRLSSTDPFLDIGSVWYMLREISGGVPYTQETTRKRGFQYIGVASRGDLCDYLAGHIDTCPGIVRDVIEGRKRLREDEGSRKRSRMEGSDISGTKTTQSVITKTTEVPTQTPPGDVKAADISMADVLSRVRPVKDLDVLVRAPGRTVPNADLILRIAQDEVNNWYHRIEPPAPALQDGKTPLLHELEKFILADKTNLPIILVPCNKNAPVNLLNAEQLLQDGAFTKTDQEKLRFFESTRPEHVEIARNVMGKLWTFEVRDTAKNFTKSQWLRVVAVVTDGSDWQFKGWPFESITDLFCTVKGVYFAAVGAPVPQHVTQWAVTILSLSPLQFQHRFSAVRDMFWSEVEGFLTSARMKKFVNHTTLQGGRRIVLKPKPIL